jgi:hypothetical protein
MQVRATQLEYTGSGTAIELTGSAVAGSILDSFELNHSGTADYGVRLEDTTHVQFRDFTMSIPTVQFTIAGMHLGVTNSSHTLSLTRVHIRKSAPTGLIIDNTNGVYILDSTIHHHSACNINIGKSIKAKDTHIMSSRLEVNEPGHTTAVSLCLTNAEAFYVDHSHFEIGEGADWAIQISSSATQCEHCVFTSNYFSALNSNAEGFVHFDAPGTNPAGYFIFRDNRFVDNVSPGPMTNPNAFTVSNSSGNGGVNVLIAEGNQIQGANLGVINNASLVAGWYRAIGNYQLGATQPRSGIQAVSDCIQATPIVTNIGAGVDTLMTCTIGGGHIRDENVGVRIVASGITAANANNKQIRVLIDGQVIFNTGVVAANNVDWMIRCEGARSSSSGMRVTCQGNPLTATTLMTDNTILTGLTFGNNIVINLTGEAVADADISQQYFHVELIR